MNSSSDDKTTHVLVANPFAAHQQLLRERLYHVLTGLHPLLYADVIRALEETGKLLAPSYKEHDASSGPPAGSWSLLTFLVAHHVDPQIDLFYASSVAVAVECFICALDLLDDIEDDDLTPVVCDLGPARVLNVSTTLLTLAQKAILSLSALEHVGAERITSLLDVLQETTLTATAGQHRDLLAEQTSVLEFTHEECIEIASAKAGSLMRLPCLLGAICAGGDQDLCQQFAELGQMLGIAHQLDNDCHDLYHLLDGEASATLSASTRAEKMNSKTDLIREKKTLPVVFAAKKRELDQQGQQLVDKEEKKLSQSALQKGIIAAWGICLLYRERARNCLQQIENQRTVSPTLRCLLNLA